ncbi:MAG TPA: FAD-binding protein, partial [Chloroflexota bacterium]|nr:FAD-binding protein [Chloroflexota bacterium]
MTATQPASAALFDELERIVGPQGVVRQAGALASYESDGFLAKGRPAAVCLPRTTAEVSALVKWAAAHDLPVIPRGAGTGLSGGATAARGGLMIGTSRMNRILQLDPENQRAVVQPGVVNLELTKAADQYGLYYAPDPSSQSVSTIGGNVAENAGGAHCLKYGVTTNHVLGMEAVRADGSVVRLGSFPEGGEQPGYDLPGLVCGSEGNLVFATAVCVRLQPRPESVRTVLALFDSALAAGDACSGIISAGIVPA